MYGAGNTQLVKLQLQNSCLWSAGVHSYACLLGRVLVLFCCTAGCMCQKASGSSILLARKCKLTAAASNERLRVACIVELCKCTARLPGRLDKPMQTPLSALANK
jgi:hypothetical protein